MDIENINNKKIDSPKINSGNSNYFNNKYVDYKYTYPNKYTEIFNFQLLGIQTKKKKFRLQANLYKIESNRLNAKMKTKIKIIEMLKLTIIKFQKIMLIN